jgi:hypothetical protein
MALVFAFFNIYSQGLLYLQLKKNFYRDSIPVLDTQSSPVTALCTLSAKYWILPLFKPAMEIRPSAVMYTCAFSARAFVCGPVRPVKLWTTSVCRFATWVERVGAHNIPKHPDLGFDVSPLARCLEIIGEGVVKLLTHANNAVRHTLDFVLPVHITLLLGEGVPTQTSAYQWL